MMGNTANTALIAAIGTPSMNWRLFPKCWVHSASEKTKVFWTIPLGKGGTHEMRFTANLFGEEEI
jgi:hypothetical protein